MYVVALAAFGGRRALQRVYQRTPKGWRTVGRDYVIYTTAPKANILSAFHETFSEKGRFGLSRKGNLQRQFKWKSVSIDEDADAAVELVGTGMAEVLTASRMGSMRQSQIAIKIDEESQGQTAQLWTPTYKTYSIFQIDQFKSTFSSFCKIIHEKVEASDPSARLVKV
jgi:muconolactone delta-isomerase